MRLVSDMTEILVKKHVPRSAAALSYYLTISVFPFLICVSAILGRMHIQHINILAFLEGVVPDDIFSALADILDNMGGYSIGLILGIGIVALLTSSSAAFRSFTGIMGEIQGEKRFVGVWGGLSSLLFSLALLVLIYVSGLVILSGEWLIAILETNFSIGGLLSLWAWIRFVLLFLLLFGIIFGLYLISAPKETKRTHRLPGALAAAAILVVAGVLFSKMISASIKYTVLYGSLASFIILLVWLYTCGIIIILGNVFNVSLRKVKESDAEAEN